MKGVDILVSVVIPVYNRADTIIKTLESVLFQSHANIEVIIVDDCSDDSDLLKELLSEIDDPRITLIRHTKNSNGAVSRNTGIRASSGAFVALIDSDDVWRQDKLEIFLRTALEGDRECILYSQINYANKISPRRALGTDENITDYLFLSHQHIHTSTLFFHRSLFDLVQFDPEHIKHQDYGFIFDAHRHNVKFILVEEPLTSISVSDAIDHTGRSFEPLFALWFRDKYSNIFSDKSIAEFTIRRVVAPSVREEKRYFFKFFAELRYLYHCSNKTRLIFVIDMMPFQLLDKIIKYRN